MLDERPYHLFVSLSISAVKLQGWGARPGGASSINIVVLWLLGYLTRSNVTTDI